MAAQRTLAIRALLVVLAAGLSLGVATSALGSGTATNAVDGVHMLTKAIAVSPAAKPKPKPKPKPKAPICKKGQKSTKKKPCRKRVTQVAHSAANPPVAGWTFDLSILENADSTWALGLAYQDKTGNATESHSYLFKLTPDSVMVAPDLSTFTVNTGSQMGQFGAVSLTFSNVRALGQGTIPFGCTGGTWQMRSGTLTGSVRFVADGTYFKTLLETSLPADLSANTSGVPATCGSPPPPSCVHETFLFGGDAAGFFEAFSAGGQTTLLAYLQQTIAPAQITRFLEVTGLPSSDFTAAADGSSAALTTTGAAPSFTGSLSFTATPPVSTFTNATCGGTPGFFAKGAVTGDAVAHFLASPALTFPIGPAQLEIL